MNVLFSRGRNDFEHVYQLPSVPRVGEYVSLLPNEYASHPEHFIVTAVHWTPDHTGYDVSVSLAVTER
jgi:hypothetical protein